MISNSRNETILLGEKIARLLKGGMCLCLEGDLSAGKTTLAKGIAKGLDVKEIVNSPTFNILKIYEGRLTLYHIDAYRLEGNSYDLGFEDCFYDQEGVTLIEWSAFLKDILPKEYLLIKIDNLGDEKRAFEFVPKGSKYEALIKEIEKC